MSENGPPPATEPTLTATLEWAADKNPNHIAVIDDLGGQLTYGQLLADARALASGLQAQGLSRGDRVLVMLDNHIDHVVVWAALSAGSFVAVPINTAFRGTMLDQIVATSGAHALIYEETYTERLGEIESVTQIERMIIRGQSSTRVGALALTDVYRTAEVPQGPSPVGADVLQILFTSGTTGASKGVVMTQTHMHTFCNPGPANSAGPEDRVLVSLPLFHVAGQWGVYNALRAGSTVVLASRFSATDFWNLVRREECTVTLLLGAMADFLMKQPIRDDDGGSPMRRIFMVPVIPEVREFETRFQVQTATFYGSTEASNVFIAPFGRTVPSGCGWPRRGVDVRIVDGHDRPLGLDGVGELVLRTDQPWELMLGYLDQPGKTVEAFRNGWFHTGDLFRNLPDGQYGFVDRAKDSLRRRGENVSSYEVERELLTHPSVRECAIVGVPSEHTEDEIFLAAVAAPGTDERDLWFYLAERLPYFMVPRFVELFDTLPYTASSKVAKAQIRKAGVGPRTWDSETAGLKVTREGVVRTPVAKAEAGGGVRGK